MNKHPIWYLIIGITILIVPTIVYLCFLVPRLSEEYNILMTSGGIIGGAGFYGAEKIPETLKFCSLYKLASRSFTLMTVITLVNKFVMELIVLAIIIVVSFIIFSILKEIWKNARRRKENTELATEIARNITQTSK